MAKFNAIYLTSNADDYFHKIIPRNQIKYLLEELTLLEINDKDYSNYLFHLHGFKIEPQSLVFTVEAYIK